MANESLGQSEGPRESPLSGDLSGISELFGLRDEPGNTVTADMLDGWVSATEGMVSVSGDASGRLVHSRYRLIAELGAGGMGVTYRAWDTQAHVPVVVKMPKREVRQDRDVMTRFAREIDAMRAVPHESIVPITDHGDDEGCPFVAMRFLPGGSLADYRRWDEAGNPIRNPPGMLHFWLPGVAAALDHIHAKGMLHRDVKPGNIFLDGFLESYLGDFGIAKVVDESGGLAKEQTLTATRIAVGTPEYMAPELFTPRSKPDGRADQYALAVTVYEMLAGEKPFKGDRAHIVVEHSGLPVPPLASKVPGLPQRLCTAVEKGLSKKPEERFASCNDFAAAVLAEVSVLPPEPDTVRLLCPGCKNILKLPQKAAGKTGRCPRCREAMDVAADLGSLWLETEERGGGLDTADGLRIVEDPSPKEIAAGTRIWQPSQIAAVVTAAIVGFIAGSMTMAMTKDRVIRSNKAVAKPVTTDARVEVSSRRELGAATPKDPELGAAAPKDPEFEAFTPSALASLSRLATLTDAQAEAVARYQGSISLRGLTTLTDSQAELLAKHRGPLDLSGLVTLTDSQAESLAKHQEEVHHEKSTSSGLLSLDGLTSLTDAQAESLAKHRGYLSLRGLTKLADVQAESLAKHLGSSSSPLGKLMLDGLIILSELQAESLFGSYQGELSLNRLTKLSDAQAKALTNHRGAVSLDGLTTLTESQAESLSLIKGSLSLDGLATLTDSQAEALAKHRNGLDLRGLVTLTDSQAESLAKHQGGLDLSGLATLTDSQAKSLAKHSSYFLNLNALTKLTDAQAEALASYQGNNLSLGGLTSLSDAQAEALAKVRGGLQLRSLKTLSDKAATVLRAKDNIGFPGKFSR
jgi:serine/threonine protein kinase